MRLTSIYGTGYNNVKYIDSYFTSLINAFPNFDDKYELVIVDNYSMGGTYFLRNNKAFSRKRYKG